MKERVDTQRSQRSRFLCVRASVCLFSLIRVSIKPTLMFIKSALSDSTTAALLLLLLLRGRREKPESPQLIYFRLPDILALSILPLIVELRDNEIVATLMSINLFFLCFVLTFALLATLDVLAPACSILRTYLFCFALAGKMLLIEEILLIQLGLITGCN